jgi:hypothetical protein
MHILVGPTEARRPMHIVNIQEKGMFIEWKDAALPKSGDVLDFCLPLQQTGYGEVIGQMSVRWVREKTDTNGPRGIGVRIDDMKPIHAAYLTRVVNAVKTGILRV